MSKDFKNQMAKLEEKIIKMANSAGFDYAFREGDWGDYEVYVPIFWDYKMHYIGKPHYILVTDKKTRWATDEECFEVMDEIEEGERTIENDPIELEPNLTIKSFKFIRGGYPYVPDIYEYKSTKKNGKILEYNNRLLEKIEPINIPIEDKSITIKPPFKIRITDENFDKYALGMIKFFYQDFGINPYVLDGEWYEFKATLSNGQKLKSHGYNYFPYTYDKFVAYLEHYWK